MAATGEVSNYLARNLILSGEAGSGERVGVLVIMLLIPPKCVISNMIISIILHKPVNFF